MNALCVLAMALMAAGPIQFKRHDIDSYPGGYQLAVADVDGDGRPDVIALSTSADRVDWYHNPDWTRRPVAQTPRNIDLAVCEEGGRLEIALASGFYFSESDRGGQIQLLRKPDRLDEPWPVELLAVDPVVHRLRWGDLDGDGRLELVHAPIFGRGSDAVRDPKPAHLWALRRPPAGAAAGSSGFSRLLPPEAGTTSSAAVPADSGQWQVWKIDETLTVLHGLYVGDLDGDGKDELLTASFEGVFQFDFDGDPPKWRRKHLFAGAPPVDDKPGSPRGTSEIVPGTLGPQRRFLAAIEPWHGHQVVLYAPGEAGRRWNRRVLDESLSEGHALVVADFDGDGADEIVAGWRGGGGGLALYDAADGEGRQFTKHVIDSGIAVEGAVAADLNLDGVPDLVVIAGRTNNLAWYENKGLVPGP